MDYKRTVKFIIHLMKKDINLLGEFYESFKEKNEIKQKDIDIFCKKIKCKKKCLKSFKKK